jgi:hypothetical protein
LVSRFSHRPSAQCPVLLAAAEVCWHDRLSITGLKAQAPGGNKMINCRQLLAGLFATCIGIVAHAAPLSKLVFQDAAYDGFTTTYPHPASDWQTREKAFYEKLFAGKKFDVLVPPFQVEQSGFDRSTRLLMAAQLAAAITRSGTGKVADPFLVARALGDGQRQFVQEDIARLAQAVGARRVIQGYVGHDRNGNMSLTVVTSDFTSVPPDLGWKTVSWKSNPILFDDETPPVAAFESALPKVLGSLGIDASAARPKLVSAKLDLAALPGSPKDLSGPVDNPARDAYSFLLYAAMTPQYMELAQEHFAQKAYLAVSRMSPASTEYRALRAWSYMALGHRGAAIKALGTPASNEEEGLLAALNGHLPLASEAARKEANPVKRLLQKFYENKIAVAYDIRTSAQAKEEVDALKLPGDVWPFLVARAFTDMDDWAQFDNASLKLLLDYEFPVKGYSLEQIVQGSSLLGDPSKIQSAVDLSVFAHGQKLIEADPARYCCDAAFSRAGPSDYLDLLQAIGHDNLIRRLNFETYVQGKPDRAIKFADSVDVVYRGNPYYEAERSRAESGVAKNASGVQRESLMKSAAERAFNAYFWEQGQSLVSTRAFEQLGEVQISPFGYVTNLYYKDIPYRPYYSTSSDGGDNLAHIANSTSALNNATWQVAAFNSLVRYYWRFYANEEARAENLLKATEARFTGSYVRNELLAMAAKRRGDTNTAQALYRQSIKFTPSLWRPYGNLGDLLFQAGKVDEAQKVYLEYPAFKKAGTESRVAIANYAYQAGSQLYWAGHFKLAEPLYAIAASQHTGAAAEISSAARLKLLSGDIAGAMAGTLDRAQRYRDYQAYRDYLGMLHATGHSNEAWAGFDTLLGQTQQPHLWETAMVGHRMAGQSEAEVAQWAMQPRLNHQGNGRSAGAIYLLRYGTMDRVPSESLSDTLQKLDLPRLRPENYKASIYQTWNPPPSHGNVKSALAYFAQAYRALKLQKYAEAKAVFDEAATIYQIVDIYTPNSPDSSFLPYYAYAAAKAGDTSGVEKILSEFRTWDRLFDYCLAKAVVAGVAGRTQEAFDYLQLARHRRPYTDTRPLLTEYTFGEIAELLAEETKDERLRNLAIEWARSNQKSEPWHAWSYALEAKLSANPVDRRRAMAMAFYLDPKSERLAKLNKSEIDAAVKEFGSSNLFLKPKHNESRGAERKT